MWMVAITAPTQMVLGLWQHQAQRHSSQLALTRIPTQRMIAPAPIPALQAPTTTSYTAHRAMQCTYICPPAAVCCMRDHDIYSIVLQHVVQLLGACKIVVSVCDPVV